MKKRIFWFCVWPILWIAAMIGSIAVWQYGYHFGPDWLFRDGGGRASTFCVVGGIFTALLCLVIGVGPGANIAAHDCCSEWDEWEVEE